MQYSGKIVFPHKDGIHNTFSPPTIVTGSKIDFNKHFKLQFGTYVQMHEQHNNSLLPRMAMAIALRATGNEQGSYYFLSLRTGKRVVRNNWTVLPMPAKIIATIHQLTAACKKYKSITFTDKDGNIIIDDEDAKDEISGDPQIIINDINIIEEMNTTQINNNAEADEEAIKDNHKWRTVANNNRYNLRPRPTERNNKYTLLQDGQQSTTVAIPKPHAHVILTQMNIQEGIKRFGEKGYKALLKELNQLHQQEAP